MDDSSATRDQITEDILTFTVSDAALEAAAATKETEKGPQSTKGLRASFRPWVAICLRRLSRRLTKAWPCRLHGPARQSL